MNYSLHPEALGDLRDAASFYHEKAGTILSQSFLGEFEQSISKLLRYPALGSPWRGRGRRRYLMKHFPYSLIYTVRGDEIVAIEPHEAEWNLDVLESLFDFYYVQPALLKAKRDALDKKLAESGKPAMK